MSDEVVARITAVQTKYADELMEKANVVGIGVGLQKVEGELTGVPALVVLVSTKMPLEELAEEDRIPSQIEGVLVDVQETGTFFAN